MKLTVYRYDDEKFAEDRVISSRGDHFNRLTAEEKTVETAMRAAMADGENIRGTSLYTWEDRDVALTLWKYSKKRYLYELEIEETDIRHRGDVNNYSDAKDAVKSGNPIQDAVAKYWAGESAGPAYNKPRIEILVSKAKVRRKLQFA